LSRVVVDHVKAVAIKANVCNPSAMTDRRLTEAIGNWRARFLENGVNPSDYDRITQPLTEWSEWLGAWSALAEVHESLGREALAQGRGRSAGGHLSQAAVYYHFAKFFWTHDVAQMRLTHERAVACLTDALPHLDPPGRRVEIPFENGRMVGVLRAPYGRGPHPVVIVIPGLDSTKEELRPTEQLFLDRGLATFAVDGPGQGEAEYDLPIRPDWEVPGAAIIDALAQQPEIDTARVGAWGVSLGGYYAPRVATGEARVKAVVSLSGPFQFGTNWEDLPSLTRDAFRVRSFSASDQEAHAKALELSLEGRAANIKVPLLIVAGRKDRLIPPANAEMLANEAGGPVELLMFEDGNHNCMNMTYRHRPRSADWMAAQLLG
jgi:2,6-dihydroxypseudooxynicotine hydrolase